MSTRVALWAAAVLAATAVALLWHADHGDLAGKPGGGAPATRVAGPPGSPQRADGGEGSTRSRGVDAGDSFLTPALRHQFDALLLEAGEVRDPGALKQRLAALAQQQFPASHAQRATELLDRYVNYRVALSGLKPPADIGDPRALRQSLEQRQRLRERHFDEAEYQALFGAEEELDRFTLARLEIQRHPQLTPEQKDEALRRAEQELGASQRAARAEATQHLAVAAQTAALDSQGAADAERYRQRRALHGDEAAHRLAVLDQENRAWQARLAQYDAARATLPTSEAEALRQRLFSPQEQLRLEGALALRAQELQRK